MRNYTKKGTNAENFMQISLLLKKIWYLKDSRNGHFAMHYSSFTSVILNMNIICIAQCLFEANFEIFTVQVCLHDYITL